MVQPGQDRGDLGGARELVAVIGDGLPEGDHVAVGDDWLVDVDGADCGVIGGLQPAGDGDGLRRAGAMSVPGRETRTMTGALRW